MIVVLGGLGALVRAEVARASVERTSIPGVGTAIVNVLGACGLGVILGYGVGFDGDLTGSGLWIGIGFLGALTTFSTWMADTYRIAEAHGLGAALANIVGPLLVGIGAGSVAYILTATFII